MKRILPTLCTVLLIAAVIGLASPVEAGTVSSDEVLNVPIDIQPGLCPNKLNLAANGKLTVVIAGTPALEFAKWQQYHATGLELSINGVEPFQWRIEDVITPYFPDLAALDPEDCLVTEPDGTPDLVLHFDAGAIAATLADPEHHQVIALLLSGTFGETAIFGGDIVTLVQPGQRSGSTANAAQLPQAFTQGPLGAFRQNGRSR